jgi:hypothetical protein
VQQAASEAGETVGYELLRALESVGAAFGGTGGVTGAIDGAGESLADFVAGLGVGIDKLNEFVWAAQGLDQSNGETGASFVDVAYQVSKTIPGWNVLLGTYEAIADVGAPARDVQAELTEELNRAATMRDIYSGKLKSSTSAMEDDTAAAEKNKSAIDRLRDSMDKLNGRNRSVIGQRMDLREGFAEGPTGTMVGKGKNQREVISPAQAKRWALNQAATAESLAEAIRDKGGEGSKARARKVVESANERIAAELRRNGVNRPQAFANSILATSGELQPGSPGTKRGGPQGGVTYIYQFGDIKVTSSDALTQVQQQATRLAALAGSRYSGMASSKKGYQ